jgi:hypothetical protein
LRACIMPDDFEFGSDICMMMMSDDLQFSLARAARHNVNVLILN